MNEMHNQQDECAAVAKGMMDLAQKRLVKDYPFHARFVARWRVMSTRAVLTAAVTIRDGDILLFYNPDFVAGCTLPQLAGVLHHEANHVLFEHVLADPNDFPDRHAWTVAVETSVNEWVTEPLPGCPITLAQYPQLPPDEDAHTRYARLAHDEPAETGAGVPQDSSSGPKPADSAPKNQDLEPKNRLSAPEAGPQPIDNHDLWVTARKARALAKLIIKVAAVTARDGLSPEEWAKIPPTIQRQIEQLSQGSEPGQSLESFIPARVGSIDWRRALRSCVRQAASVEPAFHRPPRRFPELVGIVPGKIRRPEKGRVMAVIDSSGSIGTAELEQISAELSRMNRFHEVMVIECDAAIQALYPFSKPITTVHGRGGTDLRPPFEPQVMRKFNPDVIVYFTDGCGPAPDHQPRVPVIWCLTPDGKKPAMWGREIRMSSSQKPS